nr:11954_t:CDS:2 [Entrophospora candida]
MSAPALKAFYYVTAIESWTYINIIEYYREKVGQKDLKQILDRVKKDLQEVANSNSDFGMASKKKAQEILDDWKLYNFEKTEETMDTKSAKTLMKKKNKVGNKENLNKEASSFATTFTVDSDINNINIECAIDNDDLQGYLFNESNQESIIENVDENSLSNEIQLPIGNANNDRHSEELLDVNTIESFHKYQQKIPKTRKILIPAYWGILDLTRENLNDFEIKDEDKIPNLIQMCTEEELKMSTTFPLFSGIFKSPNIKNSWGEIQAISTNKARNEKMDPFSRAKIGYKDSKFKNYNSDIYHKVSELLKLSD